MCQMGGVQDSFLCPNGTIWNQEKFACQWWYEVSEMIDQKKCTTQTDKSITGELCHGAIILRIEQQIV